MNIRIYKLMAFIQILLVSFPPIVFGGDHSYQYSTYANSNHDYTVRTEADDNICAGLSGCSKDGKGTCDIYFDKLDAAITSACPTPTAGTNAATFGGYHDTAYGKTYGTRSACMDEVRGRWGEIGQHCEALRMAKTAAQWDVITGSLFTVTAAICTVGCIAGLAGNATVAVPANIACGVGGAAASVIDIAGTSVLEKDGNNYGAFWKETLGSAATGVTYGADATAVAAGATAAFTSKAKLAKGLQCLTAALFITVAALKWANYKSNCGYSKEECDKAKDLDTGSVGVMTLDGGSYNNNNNSHSTVSKTTSHSQTAPGAAHSSITSTMNGLANNFTGAMQSAATAGPMKEIVNDMPNLDQIPDQLKDIGSSLGAIAADFQTGGPGSAITAALGDSLSADMKAALSDVDRLAKEGKISGAPFGEAPSTMSSGGGGGGGGASPTKTNPFGSFGMKGPAAGGAKGGELGFEKKKPELELSGDGDIYHSGWNGSIFQIISTKLVKSRDRIDQIEWVSPLNRALVGLPNSSKQKPGSKVGGGK